MNRPEQALQRTIVEWLNLVKPPCIWFAVPNAGRRGIIEGRMNKLMGVQAGVADLVFAWGGVGCPGGLVWRPPGTGFIELKTDKGKQSPAQIVFMRQCRSEGMPYLVCRSLEDVQGALRAWGLI